MADRGFSDLCKPFSEHEGYSGGECAAEQLRLWKRAHRMTLTHANGMRELESRLAESQQHVQDLEAELERVGEAAAAAQRRVGVLEAEVTFYAGQAEQVSQELAAMPQELAAAQQQCVQLAADLALAKQAASSAVLGPRRQQDEDCASVRQLNGDLHSCMTKLTAVELQAWLAKDEVNLLRGKRLVDGQEMADLRADLVETEQDLNAERAAMTAIWGQLQEAQGLLAAQPAVAQQLADAQAALAHQQRVSQVLVVLAQRHWAVPVPAVPACPLPSREAAAAAQAAGKGAMLVEAPGSKCAGCIKAVHARQPGSACESPARSVSSCSTICLAQDHTPPKGATQRCDLPADVGVLAASLGALRLQLDGSTCRPAQGSAPRAQAALALHAAPAAPAADEAGAAEAGAPATTLPKQLRRRGRRLLRSVLAVPLLALVVILRRRSA